MCASPSQYVWFTSSHGLPCHLIKQLLGYCFCPGRINEIAVLDSLWFSCFSFCSTASPFCYLTNKTILPTKPPQERTSKWAEVAACGLFLDSAILHNLPHHTTQRYGERERVSYCFCLLIGPQRMNIGEQKHLTFSALIGSTGSCSFQPSLTFSSLPHHPKKKVKWAICYFFIGGALLGHMAVEILFLALPSTTKRGGRNFSLRANQSWRV